MGMLDILKRKAKKVVVGMALGGALLSAGSAKANTEEVKDTTAKMEQRAENKSEIRQKIAYLDEYIAAVEDGKDKEQAYHEFALKMADGDAKKMAEMEKQAREMQGQIKNLQKKGISHTAALSFCIAFVVSSAAAKATRFFLEDITNSNQNS